MDDRLPVTLHLGRIGLYCLALFLAYLAGSYVGPFFQFLFVILLALPLVSLAYLIFTFLSLKYHQQFSTEHPAKGETVTYKLTLANETLLPLHQLSVEFKPIRSHMEDALPAFTTFVRARGRIENSYEILCPFRGVYSVGLESLAAEDPLHFLGFRREIWHRTFYVYPRVLPLRSFSTGNERGQRPAQGSSSGAVPDYALFSRLREYRQGESLRHVAWKKLASTGTPYLRQYDTSAEPGVSIYLDLRPTRSTGLKALETEDVSVETVVALVLYYLEREIPLSVRAPGRTEYTFRGEKRADFPRFYASTMELQFQPAVSPAALYHLDRGTAGHRSGSALIVSHLFDPEVFSAVEESLRDDAPVALVLNRDGYTPEERNAALPYLHSLSEKGASIHYVDGPAEILAGLETGVAGRVR
jgi:uncharacterized protein (DUF58 family)